MQFQLRVLRDGATPVALRLEAASQQDARRLAEQQGYTVLRIQYANQRLSSHSKFPLLLFCQEMRVLLEAGLNLPEAIDTLTQKESKTETRATLSRIHAALLEGRQFSDALASMPQHFPGLFVASVRACETTGNLPEGLTRFALYLEQADILKKRIVSASIYPALVLAFGGLVMLFLLGFVVPRFSRIYEDHVNSQLSLATELLLKLGRVVDAHGMMLLTLLMAALIGITTLLMQPEIRARIGTWFTRIPQIGERMRVYHLSRLYRTLAMLLRSGIPVVNALDMVSELLGQTLQRNITAARQAISHGRACSDTLAEYHLTTPVALQLFRAGEKSGQLDVMMERAAIFHEEELLRWVDAFTKLFEPLLMVGIGLVIGTIVLLMYMPIFELASGL